MCMFLWGGGSGKHLLVLFSLIVGFGHGKIFGGKTRLSAPHWNGLVCHLDSWPSEWLVCLGSYKPTAHARDTYTL